MPAAVARPRTLVLRTPGAANTRCRGPAFPAFRRPRYREPPCRHLLAV